MVGEAVPTKKPSCRERESKAVIYKLCPAAQRVTAAIFCACHTARYTPATQFCHLPPRGPLAQTRGSAAHRRAARCSIVVFFSRSCRSVVAWGPTAGRGHSMRRRRRWPPGARVSLPPGVPPPGGPPPRRARWCRRRRRRRRARGLRCASADAREGCRGLPESAECRGARGCRLPRRGAARTRSTRRSPRRSA